MRKYLAVLAVTTQEYFVYRLNFLLWRFRVVLNILLPLFLWLAVFDKNPVVGGYGRMEFISYLVYGNLIGTFIFGTRTFEIAEEINNGSIIDTLLKPVSFFRFYFAKEIADKLLNVFFACFELTLIVWFFKLQINPPHNIILFLPIFVNGVLISYFINLTLSFLGFWTTEVWPIRFIFVILLSFAAGNYFPLDLMPRSVYNFIIVTPFPYLFYLPAKILISPSTSLGINQQLSHSPLIELILISYFWLFASFFMARSVWHKGIKSFSFWGK